METKYNEQKNEQKEVYQEFEEDPAKKAVKALPPLVIAVVLYNFIAILGSDVSANKLNGGVDYILFEIEMVSGAILSISFADAVVVLALVIFSTSLFRRLFNYRITLARKSLSILLVFFCFFELLVIGFSATSAFMLLTMLCLIDVVCDYLVFLRSFYKGSR